MIPTPQRIVVCDLETILKKVCLSCIDICRRSEDLETVGKVTHYFSFLWTPTWKSTFFCIHQIISQSVHKNEKNR